MNSISIVTSAKNRTKNLLMSLESWLYLDVQEIIILDFGSNEKIEIPFEDKRIKLFRCESEFWHPTKAHNIAIQLATKNLILKLDADYKTETNFLEVNTLSNEKEFIAGPRLTPLAGLTFYNKKAFFDINGYNERILYYAIDHLDFNNRLIQNGYKKKYVSLKTIKHIFHSDTDRTQYLQNPNLSKGDGININIKVSEEQPWTKNDIMSKL
jgi:predicted glycosyltransferase involved in capsule biosynthesis